MRGIVPRSTVCSASEKIFAGALAAPELQHCLQEVESFRDVRAFPTQQPRITVRLTYLPSKASETGCRLAMHDSKAKIR